MMNNISTKLLKANDEEKHHFRNRTVNRYSRIDWINPLVIILLCIVGVFFIYSAQAYSQGSYWQKQIFWIFLSFCFYFFVSGLDYKLWIQNSHWIYFLAIIILFLTLTPFGVSRNGAQRWLDLKIFQLQPTEIAKIGTLIILASILARSEILESAGMRNTFFKVALIIGLPMLIIFKQPDLGSSLVFPPMLLSLLYISGFPKRFFYSIALLVLPIALIVIEDISVYKQFIDKNELCYHENKGIYEQRSYVPLSDYQRNRIIALYDAEGIDPNGINLTWNLNQSNISVSSGGLSGKGWTNGTQARLGYLPKSVAHNDFIFSVIAEEKGYIGSLFILSLFTILIINTIRIATLSRDRFGSLLCVGVAVIFLMHVVVNIGMTIGLMPITGLPLPYISYGGSFLISCFVLQALVQSTYRFRKKAL